MNTHEDLRRILFAALNAFNVSWGAECLDYDSIKETLSDYICDCLIGKPISPKKCYMNWRERVLKADPNRKQATWDELELIHMDVIIYQHRLIVGICNALNTHYDVWGKRYGNE